MNNEQFVYRYVSDHGFDGYKAITQQKLLQGEHVERQNCRTYPASLLEWRAITKKCNTAIEATFADGMLMEFQISFMTIFSLSYVTQVMSNTPPWILGHRAKALRTRLCAPKG